MLSGCGSGAPFEELESLRQVPNEKWRVTNPAGFSMVKPFGWHQRIGGVSVVHAGSIVFESCDGQCSRRSHAEFVLGKWLRDPTKQERGLCPLTFQGHDGLGKEEWTEFKDRKLRWKYEKSIFFESTGNWWSLSFTVLCESKDAPLGKSEEYLDTFRISDVQVEGE